MNNHKRDRIVLAVVYLALGLIAFAVAAAYGEFPPLGDWVPFAVVMVLVEWRSVTVNDHLSASPSVMVVLTAAVAFGPEGALFGVAALAALAPATAIDLKARRIIFPVINAGQMLLSATAAAAVLRPFLPTGDIWREPQTLALVALGSALASLIYHAVNLGLVNFAVRQVYQRRDVKPWSRMGQIVPSSIAMGFVGGLLGATYHLNSLVLPLVFGLFGVGYFAFASHGQLREAQESTLRGFVKALEAKDLYTRGHTERVAYFSQLIGEELKYRGTNLERLRWAALIHDVGKLAVPGELIRKRGRLDDGEYEQLQDHAHVIEDILAEVDFLRPMVEIASGHHSRFDGSGYGGTGHTDGQRPSQEACILAVADAFDAMTSTRSYRVALSQPYAFAELRENSGTQFDPDVVEALVTALRKTGERYGSPSMSSEDTARLVAEGKAPLHGS